MSQPYLVSNSYIVCYQYMGPDYSRPSSGRFRTHTGPQKMQMIAVCPFALCLFRTERSQSALLSTRLLGVMLGMESTSSLAANCSPGFITFPALPSFPESHPRGGGGGGLLSAEGGGLPELRRACAFSLQAITFTLTHRPSTPQPCKEAADGPNDPGGPGWASADTGGTTEPSSHHGEGSRGKSPRKRTYTQNARFPSGGGRGCPRTESP